MVPKHLERSVRPSSHFFKTRLLKPLLSFALNMKGLKYKTEWVEYPDIEAACKRIGAPASDLKSDGVTPLYTLPAIHDPNTGRVIVDSATIAEYLNTTYPNTGPGPLFPKGTRILHAASSAGFMSTCASVLYPTLVYATCQNLLPPSYEYFKRTREESMGNLAEIAPEGTEKGEAKWQALERGMTKMAGWFEAGGDTPFVGGDVPVYADVQIAGRLIWARNVFGKESKAWGRIKAMDGGRWEKFLQRFEQWSQVV